MERVARRVQQRGVRRDILAGLSLASMTIPQVLGYTRIAGTPLVTGLYTALLRHIVLTLAALAVCAITAAQAKPGRQPQSCPPPRTSNHPPISV